MTSAHMTWSIFLHSLPFHLTPKFELRKSCWEICDSQRVWKSQFSDDFVRNSLVFAKQHVVCDKTTRCSCNFKGHFSDYVRRNLFFFPRDFENVRRNFVSDGQNRGNIRKKSKETLRKSRKSRRMSRKVWEYVPNLSEEWFWTHVENISFFLVCSKCRANLGCHFNSIRSVFS